MKDLSGYRGRTIHKLHQKYGPIVQLAPNEISFSSIKCIKAIYGSSTSCAKSPAYDNFGRQGLFQMQDQEKHRQRQNRVAHIFSQRSMQQMESLVQHQIDLLVLAIEQRLGTVVDALQWCRMTALDISGELLLGKSFDGLRGDGEAPAYVHHLDNAYLVWSLQGLAPWLCSCLRLLPIQSLQEFLASGDYVYKVGYSSSFCCFTHTASMAMMP